MIPLYKEIGEIILKEKRFDELSEYEKKFFIVKQFLYDMDKLSWNEKTDGQELMQPTFSSSRTPSSATRLASTCTWSDFSWARAAAYRDHACVTAACCTWTR